MRKTLLWPRRKALGTASLLLAAGFGALSARAEDNAPPKGPKIAPPPGSESGAAAPELCTSNMIGLSLRVVKSGQAVTQEYSDSRITIVLDKADRIASINIG